MLLSSAISKCLIAFVASSAVASAVTNIDYKVISHTSNNQNVGVMVDDKVYPLKVQNYSTLYFTGKAPVAKNGYKYVILTNGNTVVQQENFTRSPIVGEETYNEYYNRSWNSVDLYKLPSVLAPLPIINRIESDLHIDGQIPTIHIYGNQTALDYIHDNPYLEYDVPMNMTYISLKDVKVFNNITMAVSGHSTRSNSKLSYKLEIKKGNDLYGYRRFKLRAMAMDVSYLKDHLVYDITEKIGLPSTRNSYVRLYLNDQPIGLFGLVENYKNPWIRNEFDNGDKNYNQGAFYVADVNMGKPAAPMNLTGMDLKKRDSLSFFSGALPGTMSVLSYLGENITAYEGPYSLKEDPSVGKANYTRIMELTKFIDQQRNATNVNDSMTTIWEKYLDVESVLRELALEIAISNFDSYLSMGNNYILYEDLQNDRIVMSGQDFDLSMIGIGEVEDLYMPGNYTHFIGFNDRPLTSALFKVPKYKQRFEEILYNITSELINPTIMNPRIDGVSTMIYQDVEWDQSLPRVGKSVIPDSLMALPFSIAVNGSTLVINSGPANITMYPLKEWLKIRSNNTLNFFNEYIYN